jgi:hypothetical protein
MCRERTEVPVWQRELERWDSLEGERLHALLIEYAPLSAFPGQPRYTVSMLAALCPREIVSVTPPGELRRKLAEVSFGHKASTPADDGEYWLARESIRREVLRFRQPPLCRLAIRSN